MLRLTLVLLAGIGVTLSVAGRDPDIPLDGAPLGAAVAQAETDLTDASPWRLALDDESGAIARALSAEARRDEESVRGTLWKAATDLGAPQIVDTSDRVAIPETNADFARVNAARVNLRAGPSTANQVLDQVVRDQRVEILDTTPAGWSRIHVPETGLTAWIFDRFLTPAG